MCVKISFPVPTLSPLSLPLSLPLPLALPQFEPVSAAFPWLYGKLSRQDAEGLLVQHGAQNGLFIVRESSHEGAYAASVCVNGRIAHHLIKQSPDGKFDINQQPLPGCTTLDEVVTFLGRKHDPPINWRTPLKICPKKLQARRTGGVPATGPTTGARPATTPARAPSTALRSLPASAGNARAAPVPQPRPKPRPRPAAVEYTYSAKLQPGLPAQRLGYLTQTKCLLRISSTQLVLINSETHNEIISWPMSAVVECVFFFWARCLVLVCKNQ